MIGRPLLKRAVLWADDYYPLALALIYGLRVIVLIAMHSLTLGYKVFLRRATFPGNSFYATVIASVAFKEIVSYCFEIAMFRACYYHFGFVGSIYRFFVGVAVAPNLFGAANKLLGGKLCIFGAMNTAVPF